MNSTQNIVIVNENSVMVWLPLSPARGGQALPPRERGALGKTLRLGFPSPLRGGGLGRGGGEPKAKRLP